MTPVQAVSRCLRNSFTFSGRASRSEFWWFVPLGSALPVFGACFAPPNITGLGTLVTKLLIVVVASMPLFAAATRRVQDTGWHAGDLWLGLKPTIIVLLSGWLAYVGFFVGHPIGGAPRMLLIGVPSFLVFFTYVWLAPGTIGSTIGQLLLPSNPGPNQYGPNPYEVTP